MLLLGETLDQSTLRPHSVRPSADMWTRSMWQNAGPVARIMMSVANCLREIKLCLVLSHLVSVKYIMCVCMPVGDVDVGPLDRRSNVVSQLMNQHRQTLLYDFTHTVHPHHPLHQHCQPTSNELPE